MSSPEKWIAGVFEVTITQGSTQSVEISADDNIMNRVKAKVINNELQLYLDEGFNYSGITIEAHIIATDMNGITNSGVGNMKVSNLDESETFSIENFGTGNISIDGKATDLKVVNEGSGDILAFDLQVENASIEIEGSGSVETHCSDNLNVTVVGSGNVFYKGNPSINTSITGSGNVIDSN